MTTEPIRNKNDIEAVKNFFLARGRYRDYAMFVAGINTAFRIGDLLNLKWKDVLIESTVTFKKHICVVEQKTGKSAKVFLNKNARDAFSLVLESETLRFADCADEYIFKSTRNSRKPISRFRAYQIIKNVTQKLGIDGNISCHSMRKTFGYHAWKMGTSPALIMNVYNHSSIEITKRYLGISQDDKDELYQAMDL